MDYQLDIKYLDQEDLVYELTLRGIPVTPDQSVTNLRSRLRPLLKLEERDETITYPSYPFDIKEELPTITQKLEKLNKDIIKVPHKTKSKIIFRRIQSRLVHLLRRTDRIKTDDLSAELKQQRAQLLGKILAALDELETVSKTDPNLSSLFDQEHDSDSEGINQNNPPDHNCSVNKDNTSQTGNTNSTPIQIPSTSKVPSCIRSEPIYKWNVKFSGDSKESVYSFLERVSELSLARNVSERELFHSALDLFSGKALQWYRSNRTRFSDFYELSTLLISHYGPPDYKIRLYNDILNRTQDQTETFIDYFACMNSMFRRHGSVPADAQLDIIIRNLSPFYTMNLPSDIKTMQQLEDECLKIEVKKYRADSYIPPSRRRQGIVDPSFAFISDNIPTNTTQNASNIFSVNSIFSGNPSTNPVYDDPINNNLPCGNPTSGNSVPINFNNVNSNLGVQALNQQSVRQLICWNCRASGHLNKQCTAPKSKYCYRCGLQNYTTKTCPRCNSKNSH